VSPKSLKIPTNPNELTDKLIKDISNSDNWPIARTIYCSLSVYGEVRLEAEHDENSAGAVG
jgi:hypothetical protein